MQKNCNNCKFEGTLPRSQPCCCCVPFVRDKWQPKYQPITYTRDEVLELMKMSSDVKHWELELANKEILDNFDKLKNQKK